MWATTLIEHPFPAVRWATVLAAALAAAAAETRWGRVPVWLACPLLATGLGAALSTGGPSGLFDGAAAALLCGAVVVLFVHWTGGQPTDALLAAGLGAWLGVVWGGCLLIAVGLAASLLGGLNQVLALRLEAALGGPAPTSQVGTLPTSMVSVLLGTCLLTVAAGLRLLLVS